MNPIRVFVLASPVISGTVMLLACTEHEPRALLAEELDAAGAPDVSLPHIDHDAGRPAGDAASSKPDSNASDEPVTCTSTPCVTQLVAGMDYFCALLSDGSIRCWGNDYNGQLGRGEADGGGNNTGAPPGPVVGITNATQISASSLRYTTCARNAGGRLKCWGANDFGQLGLQMSPALVDYAAHPTPADVMLTAEMARVDVGPIGVCALSANGDVYCWGYNRSGQLARPDAGTVGTNVCDGPGLADLGNYEVKRIVAGYESTFGLTKDHQLVGWGAISGRVSSLDISDPFPLPTLSDVDVTSVAAGGSSGENAAYCAIADGRVYCWGRNVSGLLGTGSPGAEWLPARAGILTDSNVFPQQLALSENRSCVRMTDGTIQCCGYNQLGQLGRGEVGTFASAFGPATAFEEHAVQVAASTDATCALVQGGKVMCWGGNANGELGQGTSDSQAHPIPVTVVLE